MFLEVRNGLVERFSMVGLTLIKFDATNKKQNNFAATNKKQDKITLLQKRQHYFP